MKKFLYTLTLSSLICIPISASIKDPNWRAFAKKTSTSITPSVLLGALTGYTNALYLNKYQDPTKLRIVASWFIASLTNTQIINIIRKSMHEHKIEHNKDLMKVSTWMTSWLVYLKKRKAS